jgi:hypothetical protein
LNQTRSHLLTEILQVARELPPATIDAIVADLESAKAPIDWAQLIRFGVTQTTKKRLGALADLFGQDCMD